MAGLTGKTISLTKSDIEMIVRALRIAAVRLNDLAETMESEIHLGLSPKIARNLREQSEAFRTLAKEIS